MKRIMISIKPNWVQKLATREKWLECRKNKALRKAIENEIKEKGKAKVLLYCSQGKPNFIVKKLENKVWVDCGAANGKVVGYLVITHVYNVYYYQKEDERDVSDDHYYIEKSALDDEEMGTNTYLEEGSCLSQDELYDYYGGKNGYALYVSDCVVFDKPKELSEFRLHYGYKECKSKNCSYDGGCWLCELTNPPQNFCYVEE